MKLFKTAALLIALSPAAQALELGHDVKLSGFGTLGTVSSTNRNADFISNYAFQGSGAGATDSTSLIVESRLGLQLDWQASDRLSFTTQAISKQYADGDWAPQLEMAFAKFNITPSLAVRAGRIRPAIYMLSDYLDVNYANPWVRPPVEFYSTLSLSRMDGVDFLWRPTTGPVTWLIQPFYGTSSIPIREGNTYIAKDVFGINSTASIGDFTVRAGFTQTDYSGKFPTFESGIRPFMNMLCNPGFFPFPADPTACSQLAAVDYVNKYVSFSSLGATWDNGDYFVSSEIGKRNSTSTSVADANAWYVSGGRRFKAFTPYLSYARYTNEGPTQFTGGNVLTNMLSTTIMSMAQMDQATVSLGLRYDLRSNMALKFQWDRIDTFTKNGQAGTGRGMFVNTNSTFQNQNNTVDLFSISMDFVF